MDAYHVASFILGGLVFTALAQSASIRLPTIFKRLNIITSNINQSTTVGAHSTTTHAPKKDANDMPLTRAEVTKLYKEGTWQRQAYDDYTSVLLDEDLVFPCIYATKGFKTDDQLYLFIDSDDLSDPRHIKVLASALSVYLPQSRDLGPNTSLVLLSKQGGKKRTVDEYNLLFWELLNGLTQYDTVAWPRDVPQDIDTDRWCLCFGGEPFFTVIQTPAHEVRRSRHAKGVTIVFQPKWIFDILFSSDAKRAGALSKVRALLAKYDPIPVSPELKNYGDSNSRESRQYFLMDENIPAACPYSKLAPSKMLTA